MGHTAKDWQEGSLEQSRSTTPHKCFKNESSQIDDRVVLHYEKTQNQFTYKQIDFIALSHLAKMRGTKRAELNKISKEMWEYSIGNKIKLTAEYLPNSQNI